MTIIEYYLKDSINRISAILKNKDKRSFDPAGYKTTLNGIFINIYNITTELASATTTKTSLAYLAHNAIEDIDILSKDKNRLISTLEYFKGELESLEEQFHYYDDYYNVYSVESDNSKEINPIRYEEMISTVEMPTNRSVSILDVECGTNFGLPTIKEKFGDKVMSYGITKYDSSALDNLDRYVISGAQGKTYISNNAFDIITHSPALAVRLPRNLMVTDKAERDSIRNALRYLRVGGVYFLVIPAFRLYSDIANLLCRELRDIEIYTPKENNYYKEHYPVIIRGVKREERLLDANQKDFSKLRTHMLKLKNGAYTSKIANEVDFTKVALPATESEIRHFRGTIITDRDIASVTSQSDCISRALGSQASKGGVGDKSPLVPFAFGQIGLVLSSGCIDGLIDEGNGNYHLVKGRTVKSENEVEETGSDTVSRETTTRNKVEINALFPDGTYRTLI